MPAQGTPVIQSSLPGSEVLVQAHHVPQQFQPKSPRVPSGPQQQLAALTNPWASQPNPIQVNFQHTFNTCPILIPSKPPFSCLFSSTQRLNNILQFQLHDH
ncbi:hypothetical protein R3I93_005922 [Phoxinus phoxinus]|uniref:Uncharacterized protein n=1 Tax=Phoxinus phoxinus TaxID=58324 RepID=A0AAN9D7T4_9TELE